MNGRPRFNWRDAGLGIRGFFFDSDRRNGSRGRSPSRFFRWPQMQLEGCRPRHPWFFFASDQRTGSRGRSPSRCFSGCRKVQLEGCRPRHPRGFFDADQRNGSRGRSPSRFFRLPQSSTGGMPASASVVFLRFRSEKRLARPLALQVFSGCRKFNWRDAGLGIRGVSSIQIRETAREAARPPDVFRF